MDIVEVTAMFGGQSKGTRAVVEGVPDDAPGCSHLRSRRASATLPARSRARARDARPASSCEAGGNRDRGRRDTEGPRRRLSPGPFHGERHLLVSIRWFGTGERA